MINYKKFYPNCYRLGKKPVDRKSRSEHAGMLTLSGTSIGQIVQALHQLEI